MRQFNETVLSAVTATANSNAIAANSIFQISLTGLGTGTLAGTVKLQASNDFDTSGQMANQPFVPTNWVDIPSATASLAAAGSTIIPKTDVCYAWIRAVLTVSGGAGTYSAQIKTNAV